MNKPPKSTILFRNIPANTTNWLVGIDTKFFNITQILKGIKAIPSGLHLVHYSLPTHNTELESSIRYGTWIDFRDEIIVFSWDNIIEKFHIIDQSNQLEALNYTKYIADIGEVYPYTIQYPEDESVWTQLTKYLDMELVQEFIPSMNNKFTMETNTITPSKEENMVLLEQLHNKDASRHYEDHKEVELKYTIIQMKLNNPDNHHIPDVSAGYLDKTWYTEKLYGTDEELLLGEFQLSFLMYVVIGNFCSGLAWVNLLRLISMSKEFISSRKGFSLNFLGVFHTQLELLPCEYIGDIAASNGVDSKTFVSILENFYLDIYPKVWNEDCCGKMKMNGIINEKWGKIVELIREKFDIDLGSLDTEVDENNFEIYKLDGGDGDEDGPVIL